MPKKQKIPVEGELLEFIFVRMVFIFDRKSLFEFFLRKLGRFGHTAPGVKLAVGEAFEQK